MPGVRRDPPTFAVELEAESLDEPTFGGETTARPPEERTYRLVFKHHGEPVLTIRGTDVEMVSPGFAAIAEMVERANASAEDRSPTFAP